MRLSGYLIAVILSIIGLLCCITGMLKVIISWLVGLVLMVICDLGMMTWKGFVQC